MKKHLFTLILFLSIFSLAQSQTEKVEHESRVKQDEFPQHSLQRLEPILKKSKGNKFYKEFDGENYFFELKTKYKGGAYSIKFTENGDLVDIERLYDFEKLKRALHDQIVEHLDKNYKKHRVERFQIQYNREIEEEGPEEDEDFMEDFIEMDLEDLIVNYEIEVEVLSESGESSLMELLFDAKGKLIQQRKVKRRDEDYILY
ncbi:MAG: hypothetical protein WD530_02995 [Vicingaceae bacterium]